MRPATLIGPRRATLLGIALVAAVCAWSLGLDPRRLFTGTSLKLAGEFFAAALQPAFDYQSEGLPAETPPFLEVALKSLLDTLRYAVLGMSVAVPCGALLTVFASTAWWPERERFPVASAALRVAFVAARGLIAFARSVHELLWALLFITAVGMSSSAAVIALAIPYSGTLAKIYSEMLDEHARDAQRSLRAIGAGAAAAFLLGLLPKALPDLVSYTFYRLECALRGAAVFGFIGIETIGYRIKLAAADLHYREVWTYLYLLIAASALLQLWGHAIRARLRP